MCQKLNNIRKPEYANTIMIRLFKAFADPTRLRILHLLANRGPEICVCDFVSVFGQPQATVSRHLMQLRYLGIVQDRRQGVWMHYSLAEPTGKLHKALLSCLREACDEEAQLAADLKLFDKLSKTKSLACSGVAGCASTSPKTVDYPARPHTKSGTRK